MNDTWNQLVAVLPPIFSCLAIIGVLLSVAYKRCHASAAIVTIIFLNLALIACLATLQVTPIQVTPMFMIDDYAVFYWAVILASALATCTFAWPYFKELNDNREEMYMLLSSSVLGGMALVASNHFGSLFLGFELLSVPLYGMITYTFRARQALEAGFKYMILSGIASSFLVFGMALLFAASGKLVFSGLETSEMLGGSGHSWLIMGAGMIAVALFFKLSLVPFHLWAPDVYQGAPAPSSAYLATISKLAVFALLMRLFVSAPELQNEWLLTLIAIIAFLSMLVGNLLALRQEDMKRLLAYSSIAHIGYLLTAVAALDYSDAETTNLSIETASFYLATYVGMTLGAFGIVSLVSSPYAGRDATHFDYYRGLYQTRPILAIAMAIMMLSFAGVPLTMGFIGKFYVLSVAIKSGFWWLAGGIVLGSAIGLFYYLRVMILMFLSSPDEKLLARSSHNAEGQWGSVVLIWLLSFATIFIGIYPTWLINMANAAGIG